MRRAYNKLAAIAAAILSSGTSYTDAVSLIPGADKLYKARGNQSGDRFYQGLQHKRKKGKWVVK